MNTLMIMLQAQAGGSMQFMLMMVIIFVIMWFFMIRPQQKKQKEIQKFRDSITTGTEVVTIGGIYGKVKGAEVETNTLMVEIANGIVIKVDRNSVLAAATDIQQK